MSQYNFSVLLLAFTAFVKI